MVFFPSSIVLWWSTFHGTFIELYRPISSTTEQLCDLNWSLHGWVLHML